MSGALIVLDTNRLREWMKSEAVETLLAWIRARRAQSQCTKSDAALTKCSHHGGQAPSPSSHLPPATCRIWEGAASVSPILRTLDLQRTPLSKRLCGARF